MCLRTTVEHVVIQEIDVSVQTVDLCLVLKELCTSTNVSFLGEKEEGVVVGVTDLIMSLRVH